MAITVTFACGHSVEVKETADEVQCNQCGTKTVANVVAPTPRFRGVGQSPLNV